ncbi:MAG: glycosyltransferase family 2 protein [Candidatus Hodarchaeales archaeon]
MEIPSISVVIPAYNEEHNLSFVLEDIRDILNKIGLPYEIVVVNDGSQDKTADVAREFGVVLIDNRRNLGKGGALINGFVHAKGNIIITMDADMSHRAEDIPHLIYPLLKNENVQATIGSRFVNSIGKRSTSELHLVGNRIINALILLLTGRFVSDSQSGFRAYRRNALMKIELHSSGFDIESEMTIKFLKKGFAIIEVPITCYPRKNGLTRINPFKDGLNILKSIIKATFYSILG